MVHGSGEHSTGTEQLVLPYDAGDWFALCDYRISHHKEIKKSPSLNMSVDQNKGI